MKFIKTHLWPHRHNYYRPSALKLPVFFIVVAALVAVQFAPGGEVLGMKTSVQAAELVKLTNAQREDNGLKPLKNNAKLQQAAQAKAEDMFQQNYWAHYAPDGAAPWEFVEDSGYFYTTAGENLAKNFGTSSGVMAGWMESPGHRENILSKTYEDIGIAVASGEIDGKETTVTVAMYAAPQPVGVTVLGSGQGGETLPAKTEYSLVNSLSPLATVPSYLWLFIIAAAVFAVLYLAQHIIIRGKHPAWDKKAHPHPLLQSFMFGGLVVLLLQSGLGAVG